MSDTRIRFDDQLYVTLDKMRDSGLFQNLAEIAMFCTALGIRQSESLTAKGPRDVRLSVLLQEAGAQELLVLATMVKTKLQVSDLGSVSLEERADILEAFCNGGLHIMDRLTSSGKSIEAAIADIIDNEIGKND